ncbi:MAG TPA: putative quinol monooxygenase [Actinomycetota bacterium]
MEANPIIVFASFRPLTGKEQEVNDLLTWMVGHTRLEPGCERYDLYRRLGDDTSFHLFERYRDEHALAEHRASEHYVEYRRQIADLLEGPVDVLVLDALDTAP